VERIEVEQNTPEWLALRRRYRTASETPVVLGLSPWSTPEALAAEKFRGVVKASTPATRHGHDHEAEARAAAERKLHRVFAPAVLRRGEYLASLDGLSADGREVLEVKCPASGQDGATWKDAAWGLVQPHYAVQVQHQLMVSGAAVARFWVWDAYGRAGLLVDVLPDKAAHERIRRAWDGWWARWGAPGAAPERRLVWRHVEA
jgi:putative phage-type endonuclease